MKNGTRLFPIVIIQTDDQKVKDILPQEFIDEIAIHVINFNTATATNLTKVLGNIAQAEKMPLPGMKLYHFSNFFYYQNYFVIFDFYLTA